MEKEKEDTMEFDMLNLIMKRRSIRKFKDENYQKNKSKNWLMPES